MKKYNITVNGTSYEVVVEEVSAGGAVSNQAPVAPVAAAPVAATQAVPAPKTATPSGGIPITAPMPGTILDIKVSVGQSVKKGDTVCVLEAMKMENDIPAPQDGVVASINLQKGASCSANDVIITLA